ncbi:LRR receptor-like serine/threonine-protein kinase GSO1 isoform X1 [Coffea eugenioides]|uniref:LRR receptor-like serine/threonine-protein kinase GSO1 isoform X1 n=2 Tax=Coffea eugenioides TaxID=49369 RepID=UPI000F60CB34|nr:LRR receptor-like serine/threonine-protein kinase GSO1 isoform X1 [Coffea eugenioides]
MTMGGSTHFSVFLLVAIILLCSSSKTVNATCDASEKQALMDFKKDLEDPYGRLSSWIHDVDCCKWGGVVCSNRSGRVIQLHLQSESPLSGKISHSLQNLTHLRFLDLSLNDFSGIPIPSFFGSLRSLRYLDLSGAGFQGMVPYQLGNLSSLRTLSIGGDPSYLQVDNLQWLAGLSNLEHLEMSRVNLSTASNWLEVINTIPSLVEIHLSSCQLDLISHHLGRDTFVFHANFSSLTGLDLSGNFLGHLIPRWIFGLTALTSLGLSGTSFEGPLSRDFWNLTSLENLDLSRNFLSGSLPDELIHFNNLISLNLAGNKFEGSLDGIWNWSSLASLDLSYNNFAIFLPSQLSTLTALISLDLGHNQFRGSIPSSIANISNLQYLDLSNNNLSSSLPSEVFTSKDLITLDASSNHLNGPIPSTVGNCSNLEYLWLGDNALSGSIPSNLGRCTNLEMLWLGNNALSGSIPSNLGRCTKLEILWLNDNALSGSIPSNLGRCTQLKELWLNDNALSGSIPSNLGKLSSLEHWDVSHNKLTGTLPESLWQLSKLEDLRIDDNSMEGIVSESHLDNLTALTDFDASGNSLTLKVSASWTPRAQFKKLGLGSWKLGPQFPTWIRSQKILQHLNLSLTGISNTIPPWLFNSSLKTVELSRNQFHGGISHILCEVKNEYQVLGYLDLRENSLSGDIPDCWMNYPILYHINLDSNNFTGSIPRSLFHLEDLMYLSLGNNSLTGPITFDFE